MASNPNTVPNIPEGLQALPEQSLQGAFVGCFLNGTYTSIVLFTIYKMASQHGWKSLHRPLIIIMMFIYLIAVSLVAVEWHRILDAFITHGDSALSVLEHLVGHGVDFGVVVYTELSFMMIIAMADCVMLWRCSTLWNHNRIVMFLLTLLFVAELATAGLKIDVLVMSRKFPDKNWITFGGRVTIAHGVCSLGLTVLVTLLIMYRIIILGGIKRYRAILEIIAESSAMYTIAFIIYIPISQDPVLWDNIPFAILGQTAGIASTLIIARVALGFGRPAETWNAPISTLQFGRTVPPTATDIESGGMISMRFAAQSERSTGIYHTPESSVTSVAHKNG